MEKIIKYKNLKFTLEEIEIMLNYEHSGAVKDRAVVNTILTNLEAKMIQLDTEAKDLETAKEQLAEEIKRYNDIWPVQEKPDNTAMPLDALNILCCPECFGEISVIDAVISKGGIRSAALNCECGYTAAVSDGVLLCDEHLNDTPFKLFENINSILSATDNFSPGYRNLMDKAQLWVYQQIHLQKKEFRYIMDGQLFHITSCSNTSEVCRRRLCIYLLIYLFKKSASSKNISATPTEKSCLLQVT